MHPPTPPPDSWRAPASPLTRRRLILAMGGAAATAAATACGSDEPTADSARSTTSRAGAGGDTSYILTAGFPVAEPFVLAGVASRMPFLLAAGDGAPLDRISEPVTFTMYRDDAAVGDPVTVEPRAEGLTRAYLPVVFTFPSEGVFEVRAEYEGETLIATIQAFAAGAATVPQPGQPLPAAATPTAADALGVSPICTAKPPCALHASSLADVVGNGRPTVLLVSTPAFCQTAICGPVLDLVVDAAARHPDIDMVHAEVYANPEEVSSITEATPAPIIDALGLTYEPALFLADAAGVISSRLDLIFDAGELAEAIAAIGS